MLRAKNLGTLQKAVNAGDKAFQYDPDLPGSGEERPTLTAFDGT